MREMTIKAVLREYRKNKGLSQTELAEKIGVSQNTVSSWETGRTEPSMRDHNVLKMSDKQIQAITGHKTSETLRRVYLHSLKQSEVNQNVANNMNTLLM